MEALLFRATLLEIGALINYLSSATQYFEFIDDIKYHLPLLSLDIRNLIHYLRRNL